MRIYKTINKKKILLMWLLTGLALAALLVFPTQCRAGAASGVFLCIQVLIPSLFPFMVLSSFVVSSGLISHVPSFIEKLTQLLFSLPKESLMVILLSLIGGYPVGAKGISNLHKNRIITDKQAEKMSMFCVASGPGFLVTYLGCAMLRSPKSGYILLVSQTISFIVLGMTTKLLNKEKTITQKKTERKSQDSRSDALVTSVKEAITSCGYMCAFVVLFAAICEIFIYLTEGSPKLLWITGVLEITNGTKLLCTNHSLILISALCGFGGLCVHFQVFTMLGDIKIRKYLFFLFRILSTLINGVITYLLLKIFPITASVFSTIEHTEPSTNKGITGCVFLIICCVVFLFSLKEVCRMSSNN
ncbi:MAG: hypothetical protein IJD93_08850 [Ruminococcus sp.]|nr:hypothetical protein [Ruminococcus sp.]